MRLRSAERWEHDRLASGLYAAVAARAWLGRPLAHLLWRADVSRFYGERLRLRELPEPRAILDVPCGAGVLLGGRDPPRRPRPRYVGVDLSNLMLARARRVAARRLAQVHLVRADAQQLPFADGAFDLVLAHNSMHCFPEPARAVRELARVLAPQGVLRGTAIVAGAGRRPDLVIRAALWLGMFSSRLQSDDVEAWLRGSGLGEVAVEASGAFRFFSARRTGP